MKYITILLLLLLPCIAIGEDIDLAFEYDNITRDLAVYLPSNYSPVESFELLIGLHGCGQDAYSYRTALSEVAENNGLILMCINALDDGSQLNKMMVDERGKVIPAAIDYLSTKYNIDKKSVYLTGFSCNAAMTLFHGLNNLYEFKGLIPFNAYLPPEYDNKYNLDSKKSTCFCSGTNDGNYSRNQTLYNQLRANGGVTYFNSMPGIGHTVTFPEFTNEMQECIDFIKQITTKVEIDDSGELLFLHPNEGILNINNKSNHNNTEIFNLLGESVFISNRNSMDISHLIKGLYIVKVNTNKSSFLSKLILN
ncbi:MAG: T9SS type A sorting domain-containing protein [Candidatus Kapaibacterium sp.]